ncbi:DUF2911 domain-containing protein [Lutibacter citreus]|uniref:DUF2911 domain-containing protein n=1 Tax=Lutibacter citreus TaxID=2138210 RepID=UPI000DBE50B6|nr:DUF2911 domain-containing protein [Lutibacter citreus]
MKKLKLTLLLLLITTITFAQKSPRKQSAKKIGETMVEIDFGAPSVKDRAIWGELVPFNKVWRAGANENTTISFDKDVKMKGKTVPAGKYGVFIIPTSGEQWTFILSKKNDAWGSNGYDKANDLVRFKVKPKMVDDNQEEMTFKILKKGIQFSWEKARFFIPVQ